MTREQFYIDLGYSIRLRRKAKRLTLKALGLSLKKSPSYLSDVEAGRRPISCWLKYQIEQKIGRVS